MSDATPPEGTYIHGTDPDEQARLAMMNDLINRPSLAELALAGGEKVLEMASGLGVMARAMARQVGATGQVLGIERSPEQIREARRLAVAAGEEGLYETREGDVFDPPLGTHEWGFFDVVHARFLLEHLPDPLGAVKVMVRAARPGGRIIVEDDNHDTLRIWPEPQGFYELWGAYQEGFREIGCDPRVGTRMVSLLHQAGAEPVRTALIPHTSCAGDPHFPGMARNLREVVNGARESVVGACLVEGATFDAAIEALRGWATLPDASLWYYVAWAEGRRPNR